VLWRRLWPRDERVRWLRSGRRALDRSLIGSCHKLTGAGRVARRWSEPGLSSVQMTATADLFGRPIRDLRVSVTDRCNLRCTYCMPKEIFGPDHEFLPRDQLLTFDEIVSIVMAFVDQGVTKVRITGGEPLLRKGIEDLIAMIASIEGVEDLTLTTNASLLERKAARLAESGLDRVTVSLDAMDDPTFQAMNDVGFPVVTVLEAIEAAAAVGLGPIKINAVIQRGVNEHAVLDMAEYFKLTGHIVRFIEYMDVGTMNHWRPEDTVSSRELLERFSEKWPLRPVDPSYRGEVANRYEFTDGAGEIGFVSSVTEPFCRDCTRARLSSDGKLFNCLFANKGLDLRAVLREGVTDEDLLNMIHEAWAARGDRYSELRASLRSSRDEPQRVEMYYIGG
jgi:cyclic pyranopterin phosphate synthase